MTFNEQIKEYVRSCTREVRRVTMSNYYRAVTTNQYRKPVWACKHKHESRLLAFKCYAQTYPNAFGTNSASVKMWVTANCKG